VNLLPLTQQSHSIHLYTYLSNLNSSKSNCKDDKLLSKLVSIQIENIVLTFHQKLNSQHVLYMVQAQN